MLFGFFFFSEEMRTPRTPLPPKSVPSVLGELRTRAVTVEYAWVTVQTKVNRCIFPPRKEKKKAKRGWEEERRMKRERGGGAERWRWRRDGECDSVMHAGFIVSPQRPREIISSQYGVYQSSQNTTLPSGYMSCLSASLLLSVFTCCL